MLLLDSTAGATEQPGSILGPHNADVPQWDIQKIIGCRILSRREGRVKERKEGDRQRDLVTEKSLRAGVLICLGQR